MKPAFYIHKGKDGYKPVNYKDQEFKFKWGKWLNG